jgi:hypothetical protein
MRHGREVTLIKNTPYEIVDEYGNHQIIAMEMILGKPI